RGGGRRADLALKHSIELLGYLANGLGYYRFACHGSDTAYVGVMAQEVQASMPEAVARGRDGYLRGVYEERGVKVQTYNESVAEGLQQQPPDLGNRGVANQKIFNRTVRDRTHGFLDSAVFDRQALHTGIGFAAGLVLAVDQIVVVLVGDGMVGVRDVYGVNSI